ncbi:hypothetical protein SeLEV6574_g05793 [Synchytrium endobioticum]|uniref:Retrotransposon gag domain-containing protein n=1 Tax=Synchytrium endobioticum TaxID=286115 RepID=A0A507CSB5_9FUNG|nr:hypothetical protein SeLEV6574_g05793 [Synchytrium endobioticum]
MDAESLVRLVTQLQAQVRELQAQTPPRSRLDITLKEPKPTSDTPYDGRNKQLLRPFLAQCESTFALQGSRFQSEKVKILFIGQHLTGQPGSWYSANYLEKLSTNPDLFQDVAAFTQQLRKAWGDPDLARSAQRRLETLKQRGRPASAYLTDFEEIMHDTGYKDYCIDSILSTWVRRGGQGFACTDRPTGYPSSSILPHTPRG